MQKLHKTIEAFARENDWKYAASGVFGLYKGYFFHLDMGPRSQIIVLSSIREISTSVGEFLYTDFVANADDMGLHSFAMDINGPIFQLKSKVAKKGPEKLRETLDHIVNTFQKANLSHDGCHACGSDRNVESYYFSLDGQAARYCERCYRVGSPSLPARRRPSLFERTDYRTGFTSAMFWTFLATVAVALAGAYVFDTKNLVKFSMVIPWAAFWAYNRVHADPGMWARWIVIGVGMACVVIGGYLYEGALFYEKGYTVIPILWKLLYDAETADRIIRNVLWAIVFNMANWLPIYFIMYKVSKLKPLETAQPVNRPDKKKVNQATAMLTPRPL